jgi:leucine-rich repeat kinase 1
MPALSYVLEMAPLGSLRSVLNQKLEEDMYQGRPTEKRPSLMSSLLSFRIAYQVSSRYLSVYISTALFFKVALGLEYLHSKDIAYKDMKADNILVWSLDANVKNSVNVKLSDYGLAQFVGPQGVTGIEGTPGYQAPEILRDSVYGTKVSHLTRSFVNSPMKIF